MKNIALLVVLGLCLLLCGCSKQGKLLGHWDNVTPADVGTMQHLKTYRSLQFQPDWKVNVSWSTDGEGVFDYQIVDKNHLNIGGYVFGFDIEDNRLTLTDSDGTNRSFRKR